MQKESRRLTQAHLLSKRRLRLLSLFLALALLALAGVGLATAADAPPTVTVNPVTSFNQGGGAVRVAPNLTLIGPDGGSIDRATVSLNTQFVAEEDRLGVDGQSGSNGTVEGLTWSYDEATGILTLSGAGSFAAYEQALRQITYNNISDTPTLADRQISISIGSNLYFDGTGHYYEYVPAAQISWSDAKAAAEAKSYYGLKGYLATITTVEENKFIAGKLQGNGWIGASDAGHDKQWKWVTGPEAGTLFFNQTGYSAGGNTCGIGADANQPTGMYSNWANGEPNDYNGGCAGKEDYGHLIHPSGQWNDWPNSWRDIEGYLVEYGGMDGDPSLSLTGEVTIELIAPVDASTKVIAVCSQDSSTYNILGSNAASLRLKLTNPANYGPQGAYGNYEFTFVDVGDNFTQDTLTQQCNIWFSGYETTNSYSDAEKTALTNWVAGGGQVMAGCDDSGHAPVCTLLGYEVVNDTDTYGFAADRQVNPIDCNNALNSLDHLEMSGGAGGYFAGPVVKPADVLAIHETGGAPDADKPIVIYTGKYFLTSDINMIQTGSNEVTLSDGDEVMTNNDFLAMNAFSAMADASAGVDICSSVQKVGRIRVYNVSGVGSGTGNPTGGQSVALANDTTVELILDASGSMTAQLKDSQGNDSTRIGVAKEVLDNVVNNVLPDHIPVALRVLGETGCSTRLAVAPTALDKANITSVIAGIQATDGATPLAASIDAVADDLKDAAGPKIVVLVTDGEETCVDGNPNAPLTSIVNLRATGIDVRINIVGYAIDDEALADRFQQWARAGGGDYYPANDAAGLQKSIEKALSIPYRVTNAHGKEMATGVVGDPGHALPVGKYTVELQRQPTQTIEVQVLESIETGIGLLR